PRGPWYARNRETVRSGVRGPRPHRTVEGKREHEPHRRSPIPGGHPVNNTTKDKVLTTVQGRLGRITLNRPRAINALDHQMIDEVRAALVKWEEDDDVVAVLVDGAGDRGLCAGGVVRMMGDSAIAGDTRAAAFWRDDDVVTAQIARSPAPSVVLH